MEGYSELKVIGEGSFGRAVLVRCKNTLQEYVVKEIQLPKNQSKSLSSRREAVLLSRMKHPHIVAFREAFEADHLLCIVMEYCRGGDLLRRIQQQKTTCFTLDDILRWFTQMCAGAMYIHDMRVLHRDLKSKNIFLTDNGTIKLGDFGSACVLNSPKAYAHTYVGTPYYVAPEIWENKPYNNKSDVWSLGCVLYELCTLRHPVLALDLTSKHSQTLLTMHSYFQASSWKNLILKVCRGSYPPLPKHLPYELQHLLKQMFKTNPKDRPSLHTLLTCHRVSRLLRAHLPPPTTQAVARSRRRGHWDREEGPKVVSLLGQKSLINTMEDVVMTQSGGDVQMFGPRKQWAKEASESVLQMLANTSPMSSDSVESADHHNTSTTNTSTDKKEARQRRRWDRNPPERLLSLLEKARLSRDSSTFLIRKADANPLLGPLSPSHGDDPDGSEPEVTVDDDRLQPRSDDEDTDFEEDSPCDWMNEAEKMLSERL
ncbi:serine/threonine-protein kinase Nek3 isoform X2 [Gouania willdenowi]|uniref:serine/threonine-protein kinase Nek3 isoform X2 n=1 Tax=Gouania willdenowi TaxID=441366 RepID=UPI00105428D5|nr:serine/threonine-protein kinase Nek3-like isoform X2 [Gouania willdenowi]